MTDRAFSDMKTACHLMAEHVMRQPCQGNRCKWLREQIAVLLKNEGQIKELMMRYSENYRYADAPTPYLAEVMKLYDDWTD